jgi:ComF family protein
MSTWKNFKVSQWIKFAQFWLLPPHCVVCGRRGEPGLDICVPCKQSLPVIALPCRQCGLPLPPDARSARCGGCLQGSNPVAQTVAALAYQDPVSQLIGQFKYQRKLQMGRVLTELLVQRIEAHYQHQARPELLIPVPLHGDRLRQRGYNQAQLIAEDLGSRLQIPLARQLVTRARATPAQQGLKARERKRNLRGAFATTPAWQDTRCSRVALVDDVVTTMSTVREVAKLLHRESAGPLDVHVWCLARA